MKNINQINIIIIKNTLLVNLYDAIFIREEKSIYKNEIIIEINRHLDSS